MMNKEETKKVLTRAASLIEEFGWVQGKMVAATGFSQGVAELDSAIENRCRMCLEAAIVIATAEALNVRPLKLLLDAMDADPFCEPNTIPAYAAVHRHLIENYGLDKSTSPSYWNDRLYSTQAPLVVSVLRNTAAQL